MKNIILLAILASALAFNVWWHPEPEEDEPVDLGRYISNAQSEATRLYAGKEDWECTHSIPCKLRCQRVFVFEDGTRYYTSNHKIIDNPNCVPKDGETTRPDRFPACEI